MPHIPGLYILVALLVAVSIGAVAWKVATRFTKKKWVHFASVAVVPALLFFDVPGNYLIFKHLCASQGGLKIFEKRQDVRGVAIDFIKDDCYDVCDLFLGLYGYEYVEGADWSSRPAERLHRYSLAPKESASCRQHDLAKTWKATGFSRTFTIIPDTHCVTKVPIEEISSKYLISGSSIGVPSSNIWDVFVYSSKIIDLSSNGTIAEINNIKFSGGWFDLALQSVISSSDYRCPDTPYPVIFGGHPNLPNRGLVTKALPPAKIKN